MLPPSGRVGRSGAVLIHRRDRRNAAGRKRFFSRPRSLSGKAEGVVASQRQMAQREMPLVEGKERLRVLLVTEFT